MPKITRVLLENISLSLKEKKTVIHKLMSGKTVHSVFSTGNQDLGHTYFDELCLKEHGFTH